MQPETAGEKLLVKYLLGDLSEEEQVRVEDRAFSDKAYLADLEAAEVELIDAYVRGELSQSERRAFEGRFLTSPQRRKKIEFARDLAKAAAESTATERPSPTLLSFVRGWTPQFQLAAAFAAVFVIAGVSWLAVQHAAMRTRIAALEEDRRKSDSREEALRRTVNEQQRRPDLGLEQPAPGEHLPVIASLVLAPGLSRGESKVPRFLLTPSAQLANVEIQLESRDEYPRYRAELLTRKGEEILTASNLRRHQKPAGDSVLFTVPASALNSGEYELALKGIANDRSIHDIGYYYFSVQRPSSDLQLQHLR